MRIINFCLALGAFGFFCQEMAQADPIGKTQASDVFTMIGKSPRQVYDKFGVPTQNFHLGASRPVISGDARISLVQAYEFETGGRIGFLFADDRLDGIIFDRLDSTKSPSMADFFPNDPRKSLMIECVQNDFFHSFEGQPMPLPTIAAKWKTGDGGTFYARYRLNGQLPKRYDPDSARMTVALPSNLDQYELLQFGYFPLPGDTRLFDLHLTNNNSDFSTAFDPAHELCKS